MPAARSGRDACSSTTPFACARRVSTNPNSPNWASPTPASHATRDGKRIAIAAPGFSADCLETIEEVGIRGREDFLAAGGTHFARLDCLNDRPEGMAMLEQLLSRELAGWVEAA